MYEKSLLTRGLGSNFTQDVYKRQEEFCDRFRIEAAPTLDADKIEKTIEALSHLEDCEDVAELGWIFSE